MFLIKLSFILFSIVIVLQIVKLFFKHSVKIKKLKEMEPQDLLKRNEKFIDKAKKEKKERNKETERRKSLLGAGRTASEIANIIAREKIEQKRKEFSDKCNHKPIIRN